MIKSLQKSLQITIILTKDALLIFLAIRGWKIAGRCLGIWTHTLDLSSQPVAFDLSAMVTPASDEVLSFVWV